MIGIFDSGVGGLTVYKEIAKALPNEDIIYLGDTKQFPYGNKSKVVKEQIDIIKGMKSIGYFTGKQDAIVAVTLKSGGGGASLSPVNIAHILPLGYQKEAKFYVPKYNVAKNIMDDWNLRTTIHWQPDIVFKDGKAEVIFYTSGVSANYSIVVEGVMQGGHILREVKELHVREN